MNNQTCSHDFRDVRFIGQLVYNWTIAPYMADVHDGQPRKEMQYGQIYQCNKCGEHTAPQRHTAAGRAAKEGAE